jgi:hypothetical protein
LARSARAANNACSAESPGSTQSSEATRERYKPAWTTQLFQPVQTAFAAASLAVLGSDALMP